MLEVKTTLVLGAGASLSMGYPLGAGLRQRILALGAQDNDSLNFSIGAGLYKDKDRFLAFIESFHESRLDSIDKFLARRGEEFGDVGKRAIAAVLLDCEARSMRGPLDEADFWYGYLFNRIASVPWEDLDLSKLSVVTFNYDRSLEHFLLRAFMAAYGKNEKEVVEKLRALEIIHVYGSLGGAYPNSPDYVMYGAGVSAARVLVAARNIKVIPEARDNEPSFVRAQEVLKASDTVALLGFGFDALNLKRLDATKTCCRNVQKGNVQYGRNFAATCLGMTKAEVMAANARINENDGLRHYEEPPSGFFGMSCTQLLRETLILGAP